MLSDGSGLKRRLLSGRPRPEEEARGFHFAKPVIQHVRHQGDPDTPAAVAERFHAVLQRQKDNLVLLDAETVLTTLDLDGRIPKTEYRLTGAAFGDLCHISRGGSTGLPSLWLRQLAKRNDALALQIVQEHIDAQLPVADRQLVIDTESNLVLGIVGRDSYHLLHNLDIFEWVMSAAKGGDGCTLTNGWLDGGHMRLTALRDNLVIEPQRGDIVRVGLNLENAVNGDSRVHVTDYGERLVCTNGLVSRVGAHCQSIRHTNAEIHYTVPEAIMRAADRSAAMKPLVETAARLLLDDDGHRRVGRFIESPQHGGNTRLLQAATQVAVQYAQQAGRAEDEISLWDYTNGVTETAHAAPSLKRRTEIEALGYNLMERFATPHLNTVGVN